MSEWQQVKFEDLLVGKKISYGVVQPGQFQEVGGVPLIRVNNIKNAKVDVSDVVKIHQDVEAKYSKTRLCGGELLITVVGSVGECAIVTEDLKGFNVARAVSVANIIDGVDKRFVAYQFRTEDLKFQMYGNTNDTVQPTLNLTELKQLNFTLPPLPEQKAIASVLSSLDDKIDLLHRQNKTLEAMAETLFRQWFIEEVEGENVIITLGEMIEIHDSKRVPLSKMERDKKKNGQVLYPYYGAAKVMDYIDDYIFDGDYLLLGEDGTVQDENGYPILQRAKGKFWVNNHTHVLSAKPPFNNFFLWCLLSKTNVEKAITGAVQPKINQENLRKLDFLKFDETRVIEFNNITSSLLNKLNENIEQIQTLEKLRDTLLPKLMSGEVRVQYEAETA